MKAKSLKGNIAGSKKVEKEVQRVHDLFWKAYAQRDIDLRFSFCSNDVTFIGSGLHERATNKTEYKQINKAGVKQFPDVFKIKFLWTHLTMVKENVACVESEVVWSQVINKKISKELIRNTTLLKCEKNKWLVTHVHGSVPDYRLKEGNYMANEQTIIRNKELERQVFERTQDLKMTLEEIKLKNRELEIESSLEKVRTIAMGMREPADMLEVCKAIAIQLQSLGVKEIRNVQTAIFYKQRGTYMNYEYYAKHNKSVVTETTYTNNKLHEEFALKMIKGKGEVFITHIKGKEVKDWIAYQKTTNVFIDKYLNKASSLNYYWHSLGPVALGISTYIPLSKDDLNLFQRFLKVFELSYRRYLDIEKTVAQTREAQVQLALERVRARSLAMHNTSELQEVVNILAQQLFNMNVDINGGVFIVINDEVDKDLSIWASGGMTDYIQKVTVPFLNSTIFIELRDAIRRKNNFFTERRSDKEKIRFFKHLFNYPPWNSLPPQRKEELLSRKGGYTRSVAVSQHTSISITNHNGKKFSEDDNEILKRFGNVFEQSYIRFLDMQKVEAQTREAKIEAALERVRTRTMAMQKSDELPETSYLLFQQFKELGATAEQISIGIMNEEKCLVELSITFQGNKLHQTYKVEIDEPFVIKKCFTAWKSQKKSIVLKLEGKELSNYNHWRNKLSDVQFSTNDESHYDCWIINTAFFSKGMLSFSTHEPVPPETILLLERFAGVFDGTYTRFLDLKHAEAQAREAQIETALERVRSRTMAMHKSEELAVLVAHLFEQLDNLNIKTYRCNLGIVNEPDDTIQYWATTNEGKVRTAAAAIPINLNVHVRKMYDGWKVQRNIVVIKLVGEGRLAWTESVSKYISFFEYQPENIDKKRILNEPAILSNFYFKQGFFAIHTLEELDISSQNIIGRFAKVFEQTYTRFLDLQKAEAQAREAKIEASLERVRSKAMAMHSPNDLSETVNVFFKELKTLGIIPIRCGVGQIDEATRTTSLTTTTSSQQGDSFQVIGKIKQTGHPVLDGIFDHWKLQKEYHPVLEGEDIKDYYSVMNAQIGYPEYPEEVTQYGNCFYFKEGFVFAWTESKLSEEELQIFRRFTFVLSLTYRRYIDLKEAEARAREAMIQSSLDRLRAEIASMRSAEDLQRITPLIWRELITLNVPFFRCGVFIVDMKQENVQVYLSTPDGHSLGVLNLSFDANELTINTVRNWQKKTVYTEHWNKEQFINWMRSMIELGQIPNYKSYQGSENPPETLNLHFVPFAQGMLYVGNTTPLTNEKIQLVKSLADAFSIAFTRYEDFKNLEDAKNRVEVTLTELKSAQAQLVQSEKLASLGQLTAGIAHEIKNPLNFVNNFSEISSELLNEMKIELQNDNKDEAIAIAEDIKQNLEKINQHGKRADSIVKGMLLHSRGSAGEKSLTNINDLLDQYVNLAYHGMRAQDKEFNITIEKDFDETLEKINSVPQDISRVFLNVINNGFYAANEKKKKIGNDFAPILKVSTKNLHDKVEIRIRDNGNGIPQSIKNNIFSPFFTTKPTGEGTGLGLSLSYDIITKVHNGEIIFDTKENEFTEFTITIPKS